MNSTGPCWVRLLSVRTWFKVPEIFAFYILTGRTKSIGWLTVRVFIFIFATFDIFSILTLCALLRSLIFNLQPYLWLFNLHNFFLILMHIVFITPHYVPIVEIILPFILDSQLLVCIIQLLNHFIILSLLLILPLHLI